MNSLLFMVWQIQIIAVFKSVPNCLLLTNYLKSWPFYFQNLSIDLLNWKPYTVCFKYCREYAWDCFNAQLKSCHQVVLDFLFSWWPYIFFSRPFFIGAVCPRKITLLSMPVIRSFKHLLTSLYRTSSKFSGRLIRLSILFAIN